MDFDKEWAAKQALQVSVKEEAVAQATLGIMQDKLAVCYRTHGVNQGIMCKQLRDEYMSLMMDGFKGQLFPEDRQPPNRDHPIFVPRKTPPV